MTRSLFGETRALLTGYKFFKDMEWARC